MIRIKRAFTLFLAAVLVLTGVYTQPVSAYADMSGNDMVPVFAEASGTENTDISSAETEDAIIDDAEEEKEDDHVIIETEEEIEEPVIPDEPEPVEEEGDETETVENTYADEEYIASGTINENMEWFITKDNVLTVSGNGDMPNYTFGQSPWNGKRNSIYSATISAGVTSVGNNAFNSCENLKSVTLPDSVKTIGSSAFAYCYYLETVNLGSTLTSIGNDAFRNCNKSFKSISLPATLQSLGNSVFNSCSELSEVTFLKDSEQKTALTSIGNYAFAYCNALKTIELPSEVGYSDDVFENCRVLETIVIPEATALGTYMFNGCSALKSATITFSDDVTKLPNYTFNNCESLENVTFINPEKMTAVGNSVFCNCKKLKNLTIPAGVETMGTYVFQNCTTLNDVSFGEYEPGKTYITSIPNGTFKGCAGLTNYKIPASITRINASAFQDCKNLKSVIIHEGVTYFENSVFENCTSLESIVIPSTNITYFGAYVLKGCTSLKSATLTFNATKLNKIPDNIFENDASLTTLNFIGTNNITSIGNSAFKNCTSLESFGMPANLTEIQSNAFEGCISITEIALPDTVTSIKSSAFNGCTSLNVFTMGSGLKNIDSSAFKNCTSLEEFSLPENFTTLSNNAFEGCTSLNDFHINNKITNIGSKAFLGCTSLTEFAIPASVTNLSVDAFSGCTNLARIDVATDNTTYYSKYNTSGAGGVYLKSNNSLYIRPEGNTGVLDVEEGVTVLSSVYYKGNTEITEVTIPASVKNIDQDAFRGCTNLKTVKFAANSVLEEIKSNAFKDCTSLETISVPDGFLKFGGNAFDNCKALKGFTIPASVTEFPTSMFNGCSALESVTVADGHEKWYSTNGIVYKKSDNTTYFWPASCHYFPTGTTRVDTRYRNNQHLTEILIPCTVTGIDNSAFQNCAALKTVVFETGIEITSIPSSMFDGCTSLETVTLPSGLTSIGGSSFKNCTSLTTFTIPSGVKTIGDNAFYSCTELTSIGLPSDLETIKYNAFQNCKKLGNVTFPSKMTTIEGKAFYGCEAFTKIDLPNSLMSLSSDAFQNCANVTEFRIPSKLTSISSGYFNGMTSLNTVTFDKDSVITSLPGSLFKNNTILKNVTLPTGLTTIGDNAFYGCTELTDISLPNNLVTIRYCAFQNCKKLKNVTFPSSLTTIENRAFAGCEAFTKVTIPNSVTTVEYSAFEGCTKVTEVTISNSLTNLNSSTFKNMTALKTVTFNATSSLNKINYDAFADCTALTSITLPKSLTDFNTSAFSGCTSLKSVNIEAGNTVYKSTDGIVYKVSDGSLYFKPAGNSSDPVKPKKTYYDSSDYRNEKNKKVVTIPKEVTVIKADAFSGASELTTIKFASGSKLTTIESKAFYNCKKLKSITLPGTVTSIGNQAFYSCYALTKVNLPAGLTTIGEDAYRYCSGIKTVKFGSKIKIIGKSAFSGCNKLTSVSLPGTLESIGYDAFYNCGKVKSVKIAAGEGTKNLVWGDYAFQSCSSLTKADLGSGTLGRNMFMDCDKLKTVKLSNNLTAIGQNTFNNLKALQSITIPESVKTIGASAFSGCTALTTVTLKQGLESIGASAFLGDAKLKKINIPEGVTGIGSNAFSGVAVTDMTVPASITVVTDGMFYGMGSLKSIAFKGNIESIGYSAFGNCKSLTEFTVPNTVKSIGNYAFSSCTALKKIMLPEGLESIGTSAFAGSGLKEITITEGVQAIKENTFNKCSSLKKITIPASVTEIDLSAFSEATALERIEVAKDNTIYSSSDGMLYKDGKLIYCPLGWNETKKLIVREDAKEIADGAFKGNDTIIDIIIPASVEKIGDEAFSGCTRLKSVTFEEGSKLTKIPYKAFYGCFDLNHVTFEGETSIELIDEYAFFQCEYLTDVTFENNTKDIKVGRQAFSYDKSLQGIYSNGKEALLGNLGVCAFYCCESLEKLALGDSCETITINTDYAPFYECYKLEEITVTEGNTAFYDIDGVLFKNSYTISSKNYTNALFAYTEGRKASSYTVPEGTSGAMIYAFYNVSNLENVTLPDSFRFIDHYAFAESGLKTITNIGELDVLKEYTFRNTPLTSIDLSGYTGKNIGNYTFSQCTALKEVVLPEDITVVSTHAFYNCSSLKTMNLPDTVTGIGTYAFYNCYAWEGARVPAGAAGIGNYAFYNCEKMKNIVIPIGCEYINDRAFYSCDSETVSFNVDVSGNSDLEYIGLYAFANMSLLKEIDLPEGLTKMDQFVFDSDYALKKVTLPSTLTTLDTSRYYMNFNNRANYGNFMFRYCTPEQLIIKNPDLAITSNFFFRSSDTSSDSCKKVVYIYAASKGNNDENTKVYDYVTKYSEKQCVPVFVDINDLGDPEKDPYLSADPEEGSVYNGNIFLYENGKTGYVDGVYTTFDPSGSASWEYDKVNKKLTIVSINGSGKICDSPWSTNFQKDITYLDVSGNITGFVAYFYNYTELKEVSLPAALVSLDYDSFEYCRKLEKVTFAKGCQLKTIGNYAFDYCESLKKIELPDTVTYIGNQAFDYCKSIEEINLPKSLERTGEYAFYNCSSLTSLVIDHDVAFGNNSFGENTALKNVILKEGVTSISDYLFSGCPIETLHIPASVTDLTRYSFEGLDKLKTVTIAEGNEKYEIKDGSLYEKETGKLIWSKPIVDEEGNKILYIHKDFALNDIDNYIYNNSFVAVMADSENPYFSVYDNAIYSKDGTILYYVVKNYEGKFTVREKTTQIRNRAFADCKNITEIELPDSVYEIGYSAFSGDSLLSKINLPASLVSIGGSAFYNCKSLRELTFPDSLTTIGTYAFGYSGLQEAYLPEGLISLGNDAFYYCKQLRKVVIPGTVSRIGSYAFYNCSKLSDVRLNTGIKEIGNNAFAYTGLESIVLPDGLKSIESNAFYGCSELWKAEIPESVDYIYGKEWYVSNGYYYDCSTPFDYCDNPFWLYVVPGSYAESYAKSQKQTYRESNNNYVSNFKYASKEEYVKYTITYMLDSKAGETNSQYNLSSFRSTDDTIELFAASKPGFAFGGWYRDSGLLDEVKTIVPAFEGSNIVLYPKWLEEHTVTLMSEGNIFATIAVADGFSLLKAEVGRPEKDGYRFIGWIDENGNAFGEKEPVTSNMVLTAMFVSNADAGVFAPTSNVKSGRIENGAYVTLSTETLGASIYYTKDDESAIIADSVLSPNAIRYADTIEISGDSGEVVVIKAVAEKDGIYSKPVCYTYTIADSSGDWGDIALSDRAKYATADDVPEGIWFAGYTDSTVYSGSKKTFDIRVYHNNKLLKEKTDYTITYKNNINAYTLKESDENFNNKKAPSFTITGKGNYKDTVTKYFVITPADMLLTSPVLKSGTGSGSNSWSAYVYDYNLGTYTYKPVNYDRLTFNGKRQQAAPGVTFNGKKLKKDKDYRITWSADNDQGYKNPGTYKVTVTGIGNFGGIVEGTYTIEKDLISITKANVMGIAKAYGYTGKSIAPEFVLTYKGKVLAESDYTYQFSNNSLPGKATLTIYGRNGFKGVLIKTFKISGINFKKKVKVENLPKSLSYTGKEIYATGYALTITEKVTVAELRAANLKSGDYTYTEKTTLKPGTDYTAEYKNNLKAGTATITFTGKGKYTGTIKKTFKITPVDTVADSKLKYPNVVVKMDERVAYQTGGTQPKPVVTFKGLVLKEGADYKLTYKNNTKIVNAASAGKNAPSVTIAFKGNFKGSRTLTFDIVKGNISALSATAADCEYTGKGGAPAAVITINDKNGKALKANTDYTCTYFYEEPVTLTGGTKRNAKDEVQSGDIIPAGATLRVKISGTGNYEGSLEAVYHVVAANVAKAGVTVKADSKFIYSGKGLTPRKSDLTVSLGGVELSPSDYEITECKNNVENGKKATFTIKGISNNYGGTKTVTFTIDKKSVK